MFRGSRIRSLAFKPHLTRDIDRSLKGRFNMATATKGVEQIVRRVLKEEQDETLNAIQELSALLTEEIIPKLSHDENEDSDAEPIEEQDEEDDVTPMSAAESEAPAKRQRKPPANGRDEAEDDENADLPDAEIPETVTQAFAELYQALSPEQASALAEFFTAVNRELDEQGNEEDNDETGEETAEEDSEEVGARG
jgi:hypothetical protein